MNFRTIRRANGDEAVADDMSPWMRAFDILWEHATRREQAGLRPSACQCDECWGHRATLEAHLPPEKRTQRPAP